MIYIYIANYFFILSPKKLLSGHELLITPGLFRVNSYRHSKDL